MFDPGYNSNVFGFCHTAENCVCANVGRDPDKKRPKTMGLIRRQSASFLSAAEMEMINTDQKRGEANAKHVNPDVSVLDGMCYKRCSPSEANGGKYMQESSRSRLGKSE
jgi:hypothetical protein